MLPFFLLIVYSLRLWAGSQKNPTDTEWPRLIILEGHLYISSSDSSEQRQDQIVSFTDIALAYVFHIFN